jgi:hypothetical protein
MLFPRPFLARPLLLSACSLALVAQDAYDRPDLRRDWEARRGTPTSAYVEHLAKAAENEARAEQVARKRMRSLAAGASALNQWVNLGPFTARWGGSVEGQNRVSGRINMIVTHPTDPKLLYVATAGGGVFKCTNADPQSTSDWVWTPITDTLPSIGADGTIAVGALAMSPADPNVLYLMMGDPLGAKAKGFYISRDAGATWAQGGSVDALDAWEILPLDASRLLIATNAGLFRSTDAGRTFTNVLGESVCTLKSISPTELVAGTMGGKIFTSSDSGATWQASTLPATPLFGRLTLAAIPNSPVVWALGAVQGTDQFSSGLLKSQDKGRTWTWVAGNNLYLGGQSWYNQLLTLDPQNPDHLYAAGVYSPYRSMNGGLNWTGISMSGAIIHSDFHTAAWSKTGTPTLFIGHDGGLTVMGDPFRLTLPNQADATFIDNSHNKGIASHLIYHVGSTLAPFPADAPSRISLGLQDNGTMLRDMENGARQGSATFTDHLGADGIATLIHRLDGDLVLGTVQLGGISRSTDGGLSWGPGTTGLSGDGYFFTPLWEDRSDITGNTVYTARQGALYRSTDFALNWTSVSLAGTDSGFSPTALAACRANGKAIAVSNGNSLYTSVDGGTTWTKASLPASGVPNIENLWFDTASDQVIYLACDGYAEGMNHLWRSQNGGRTWTALDGSASAANGMPFGVPVHMVQNDPQDSKRLFAATDMGMYQSADGGTSWSRMGAGMPLVAVRDFYLAPDGTFLRAATYGRGVWEIRLRDAVVVQASIPAPASDVTVESGQSVAFQGAATKGQAGAVFTYAWDFGDGVHATGASVSHAYTNMGGTDLVFPVRLVAQDVFGAAGGAVRNVTVHPAPDVWAPTLDLLNISGKNGVVQCSVHATDNRSVTRVEYYVDGVLKGVGTPSVSDATFFTMDLDTTALTDGNHTLMAKAFDAAGNSSGANLAIFTNNAFDIAILKPFMGGIGGGFGVLEGTPIDFEGSATVLKAGRTVSATWSFGDGGTATGLKATHTFASGGTRYPIVFKVTDSTGFSDQVTGNLYVRPKPTFPEAEPNDTLATANVVAPTYGSIQGNLLTATDKDHFSITVQPGQSVEVTMSGPTGVDWDLYLKSTTGSTLAKSETSTTSEHLIWKNNGTTAQSVILQVVPYSGGHTDPYTLKLSYSSVNVDTQSPSVTSVTFSGTSGAITLGATASDNVGVTKVEFYMDGQLIGTSAAAPYTYVWVSTATPNGNHAMTAKAYDAAGNSATSQPVTLALNNPVTTTMAETESNGTLATANPVGAAVTTITGYVGTSTDVDLFKFDVAAGKSLKVDMTGPSTKDYDLYVLSSSGAVLKSSEGSTASESVSYTNTGSSTVTVYVRVKGYNGAYSTTLPYTLKLTR